LARAGADLLLIDVAHDIKGVPYKLGTADQLEYVVDECREHGVAADSAHVDIRDLSAAAKVIDSAVARYAHLDILINNAGIAAPSGKLVHEIDEDEWDLMISINLSGAWRMTKVVGRVMIEQRSGNIINVASTAALVG